MPQRARRRPFPALLSVLLSGALAAAGPAPEMAPRLSDDTAKSASDLRDKAMLGTSAAEWVRGLTTRVGPRLSGSLGDRLAVAWALETLTAAGLVNVRKESVTVPAWERGEETAAIVSPVRQRLVLTALGGSVPTPDGGLEGEVIGLASLEDLDGLVARDKDALKGRLVFFDKRTERAVDGSGYGNSVDVRVRGASRAAKHGATGVLIRSIGTSSNRLPHTGTVRYEEGTPRIPAAALSAPDADLLSELLRERDPVRVRFTLTCRERPSAESFNVIGEVLGREKPDEIVVLGAHLDSWDLGTGALDDGAGCGIVIETARRIAARERRPRRTIRVVLFVNEENGLAGAKAYAKAHEKELARHAAAFEADSGTGRAHGFTWIAGPDAELYLKDAAGLLSKIGADVLKGDGTGGADISILRAAGVPLFGLRQDASTYFDHHHTANDTFDKIEPRSLDQAVAALATMAYAVADAKAFLPRIPESMREEPRTR